MLQSVIRNLVDRYVATYIQLERVCVCERERGREEREREKVRGREVVYTVVTPSCSVAQE